MVVIDGNGGWKCPPPSPQSLTKGRDITGKNRCAGKQPANSTYKEYKMKKDTMKGSINVNDNDTANHPVVESIRTLKVDQPENGSVNAEDAGEEEIVPVSIDTLTADYVEQINKMAGNDVAAWIYIGKLVVDYVAAFKEQNYQGDAYKTLAQSENITIKDKQLRHYASCYDLYHNMGENAPKLPMTHYIAVLSLRTSVFKKKQLLDEAYTKKLSVSELKDLIAKVVAPQKKAKPATDLVEVYREAGRDFLTALMNLKSNSPENDDGSNLNRENVREVLLQIIWQAVEFEYIHPRECCLPHKDQSNAEVAELEVVQ